MQECNETVRVIRKEHLTPITTTPISRVSKVYECRAYGSCFTGNIRQMLHSKLYQLDEGRKLSCPGGHDELVSDVPTQEAKAV